MVLIWARSFNQAKAELSLNLTMPNSKRLRERITKHLNKLDKHLHRLEAVAYNCNENAQTITVPVDLGYLRSQYSPRHKTPIDDLDNLAKSYRRIPIDSERPLFIYGLDGGLIAYRISLDSPDLLATLTQSIRELPKRTGLKFRGIYRGKYSTRHYCIWSPYSRQPFVSRELRDDGEAGLEFLKKNQALWNRLSDILGGISPETYKSFLRYPLPKRLKRFCTAWAGCVVNIGDEDPVQTEPHRDVKESKFGYSCIVTAGDYTGGAVICHELELIVELDPGFCFFFPDSLITHSNEKVTGKRSSVVAFTQENLFSYWRRKYKYVNNKDKGGLKDVLRKLKSKQ